MTRSILIVDDDACVRESLRRVLRGQEWEIAMASDATTAIVEYERVQPSIVLLDHGLPGLSGLQLLQVLRERDADATVLMLTGQPDIPLAVEAMRLGAENFLPKPIDATHLGVALARAYEHAKLRRQNRFHCERRDEGLGPESVAGATFAPQLRRQLELLAEGTAPVLLTGETGTGKGWVAQLLHARSARARAPFVEVNCAGLTATFLDAELFGHEKGAFTDAKTQKSGLFELADGGTLFLDEIGDLAPELQPKLLKVLESQRFRRLGGTREITVDVRLVAATHQDLRAAVRAGRFRQDLYYRLAVFPVHLPPLRERGHEAVRALAQHFLTDLRRGLARGPTAFDRDALALLRQHDWPGNIRELRNTIERVLLLARDDETVRVQHLPPELRSAAGALAALAAPVALGDEDLSLASAERRHIARVLAHVGGNRARAARALRISRATLYKKLEQI
jgi:DNA-binding NtrC family response regulator